ncbi:MAG: hypothetical protein ABUS79_00070 [Pseudomonadota bacterium]
MARANTTSGANPGRVTLRQVLGICEAAMDQAMAVAYQHYLAGRFTDAEMLCQGLIACDPLYWWAHSLHASVLRRLGRHEEALIAVEGGLKFEPGQPKLLLMRTELALTIARKKAAAQLTPPTAGHRAAPPESPAPAGTERESRAV